MKSLFENNFSFLEACPHFYEKKVERIAGPDGVSTDLVYTYYAAEVPVQTIAEIRVPVHRPHEEFKWKFLQLNAFTDRPIFQKANALFHGMPGWFQSILIQAMDLYNRLVSMKRMLKDA